MKKMYPKNGRVILHIDANAFYASVEAAYNAELNHKPVAIAGNPKERRGIVVTCNYIARSKGVHAPMPLWEAKQKCPDLVVLKPNFSLYREISNKMFDSLKSYSNMLEPASIDEGYLDITSSFTLGSPLEIAEQIQQSLLSQLKIPVSIGIAPNKFLAKTASDMKKPLGITVLRKRDVQEVLWPLDVGKMHGIGQKTAEKLNQVGIETIGQLAKADEHLVKSVLGLKGKVVIERANGVDHRVVNPNATEEFKSIGHSTTLPKNETEERVLLQAFERLSQSVCQRMQQKKVVTQHIQITIRYSNFQTVTRSETLPHVIELKEDLFYHAVRLFRKNWNGDSIRLLGVTASQVVRKKKAIKQLNLFTYEEEVSEEPLLKVIDQLKQKFGDNIIQKGMEIKSNQDK
ncbi:DNA polymerase IV [Metabacillus iocasae]|uniref:DNA polymerase IV n=1 Tax=Priestia iocasae TaxID=2291674 RepID=A0ABS2QZ01_9BACI|nr:DNA polymerase IV [Metabacillus iocasae]MBM7703684.1 DNA polymerase-4 [Metabacillus iocasae]